MTTNKIQKTLIIELSKATTFEGVKNAFATTATKYPQDIDQIKHIYTAIRHGIKK